MIWPEISTMLRAIGTSQQQSLY